MSETFCELDPASAGELPSSDHIFASAKTVDPVTAADPPGKIAGAADSSRNSRSTVKAPGGRDAAHQKDGG